MSLKVVSWNINGLRALATKLKEAKLTFDAAFAQWNADIICFQETKLDEIKSIEDEIMHVKGFESFWSVCKSRKGYSGTATFVKSGLTHDAKVAFGTAQFDDEGRVVMTDHGAFVLFNVYFPNSGKGEDRRQFKVAFYHWFRGICDDLIAKGRQVIVCGDVNTTHKEIDYHGHKLIFSDEERGWLDLMFDKSQFVDMFRHLHPTAAKYTWWDVKTGMRPKDLGYRIDYFFVHNTFLDKVESCNMMTNQLGSDHCPIFLELKGVEISKTTKSPSLSSNKIRPKQQKLSSFFGATKSTIAKTETPKATTDVVEVIDGAEEGENPKKRSLAEFFTAPQAKKPKK